MLRPSNRLMMLERMRGKYHASSLPASGESSTAKIVANSRGISSDFATIMPYIISVISSNTLAIRAYQGSSMVDLGRGSGIWVIT